MRSVLGMAVFVSGLATLAACGPNIGALQRRASFDLGCDASRLEVVQLGDNQMGVTGCECRATYVDSDPRPTHEAWILNSTSGACQTSVQQSGGEEN